MKMKRKRKEKEKKRKEKKKKKERKENEKKRKDTATSFSRWLPLSGFTVAQHFYLIIDTEGTGDHRDLIN